MKDLRNKLHFHMLRSHHSELPPTIENRRSPNVLNPYSSNFVIGEGVLAIGSIGDFPRARGPINRKLPNSRTNWEVDSTTADVSGGGKGKALCVDPRGTLEPRGSFFTV
jgi:hypothetical protein